MKRESDDPTIEEREQQLLNGVKQNGKATPPLVAEHELFTCPKCQQLALMYNDSKRLFHCSSCNAYFALHSYYPEVQ